MPQKLYAVEYGKLKIKINFARNEINHKILLTKLEIVILRKMKKKKKLIYRKFFFSFI